jgi:deoxyribose-phosphate aldolase
VTLAPEVRRLAALMDQTHLKPETTRAQIEEFCRQALPWGFAAVCIHPYWVPTASQILHGSGIRVGAPVGFPFGATGGRAKRVEAEAALLAGAQEIDMVMNIGALKSGELAQLESEIRGVAYVCRGAQAVLKVILETAYLSDAEKVDACQIAQAAGADFVKTSTGLAPAGAIAADVRLLRRTVGPQMGVKASGGIRTLADALRMLEAGANRLGTSAGVAILEEAARRMS